MTVVRIDKKYFRPNEVNNFGNSTKAKKILNWKPKTSIYELIAEMMENDLKLFKKINYILMTYKVLIAGQEGMVGGAIYNF